MALPSLDLGRFVAASLVLLFHYGFLVLNFTGRPPLDMALRAGHAGVNYFFVLSGFIILYAHRRDLGRPRRVGAFFRKRAVRILPMLWLTLLIWGLLRYRLSAQTTTGSTGLATLALDMLLLPHPGPLVLGVTWTLTRELVFYLLFAAAILHRRGGLALLALWQVATLLCTVLDVPLGPWGAAFLNAHNLGFGIGLLIAMVPPLGQRRRMLALSLLGMAMFGATMALEWWVGGPLEADYRPLGAALTAVLYSIAAGVTLLGLAQHDYLRPPRPERRWIRLLAGSSYVLYLVHGPVGSLAVRTAQRLPLPLPAAALLPILAAIGVGAALAAHVVIERPILARLRPRPPVAGA